MPRTSSAAPGGGAASPQVPVGGDTFDLVSIGGQLPSLAPATQESCAAERPVWAYYVLQPDSTYHYRSGLQADCPASSAASPNKDARYEARGDTLILYLGDGNEEFQDGYLIRSLDSLSAPEQGGVRRFARRRTR
jgi:hypothetical protein